MNTLTIFNFGVIDNLVLVLAFYITYLNLETLLEKHLKIKCSAFLLGVITAGLSNAISDGLGFLLQGQFYFAWIVFLGCIAGMLIIPLMQFYKHLTNVGVQND